MWDRFQSVRRARRCLRIARLCFDYTSTVHRAFPPLNCSSDAAKMRARFIGVPSGGARGLIPPVKLKRNKTFCYKSKILGYFLQNGLVTPWPPVKIFTARLWRAPCSPVCETIRATRESTSSSAAGQKACMVTMTTGRKS